MVKCQRKRGRGGVIGKAFGERPGDYIQLREGPLTALRVKTEGGESSAKHRRGQESFVNLPASESTKIN